MALPYYIGVPNGYLPDLDMPLAEHSARFKAGGALLISRIVKREILAEF